MGAGLHVIKTFSICTGYDLVIVCPYVIATRNMRMCINLAGVIVACAAGLSKELCRTYRAVADPVQRLAYIMTEHQLRTAPDLSDLHPLPAKRRKNDL